MRMHRIEARAEVRDVEFAGLAIRLVVYVFVVPPECGASTGGGEMFHVFCGGIEEADTSKETKMSNIISQCQDTKRETMDKRTVAEDTPRIPLSAIE